MAQARSQWKSKFGFILAASGSAIGLGNIVFFPANAYRYGGGAFYVPYFVALFLIGIPVMITEFGLGGMTRKSFPLAMKQAGGKLGEFFGWFAILNAAFITMYYITILGWVVGMGIEAWQHPVAEVFANTSSTTLPQFGGASLPNPTGTFFKLISSWTPLLAVIGVWLLNFILVSRGTKTIEIAVKVFVPLMWLAMIVLVVLGFTLPGGFDGVKALFTPDFDALSVDLSKGTKEGLRSLEVWQGAIAQMFFTLSLGFGVMTAYASYLPDKSDHSHNAITTSLLNCGFEWISGVAIFAILFAFSILPGRTTLSMMFFVTPAGIADLPQIGGVNVAQVFGICFFVLLLIAGLTSSISLVEALAASMQDKFKLPRWKTLLLFGVFGCFGSACFALPQIVNRGLEDDGTLGLTLVDLIDHWAFSYGLLIVGLFECLIIGWGIGSGKIRRYVNERSRFRLGIWFDILIRFLIPLAIAGVIAWNIYFKEMDEDGIHGASYVPHYTDKTGLLGWFLPNAHLFAIGSWAVIVVIGSMILALRRGAPAPPAGEGGAA